METIAFRVQLDPGKRAEYERRHREIWPELPIMRKCRDGMAGIMQTDAHDVPLQQPLVQVFHLP